MKVSMSNFAIMVSALAGVSSKGVLAADRHVRGATSNSASRLKRKLQMNNSDKGGSGDGGDGLQEIHPCEPDAQRALDHVAAWGRGDLGDEGCLADPVNGCGGGCCRLGIYFICDEGGFAPHLPCVCNANTAPIPEPVTDAPVTTAPVSDDIVDTAIGAGSFTTLVDLVSTAGLVETLRGPGPFTVFAPLDSAFPSGVALDEFKSTTDLATLTSILTYHVVPGAIRAADLSEGATVTTVQGDVLTISLMNGPMVNGANIVTTDIETANGVIHVIDAILMPPSAGAPTGTAAPAPSASSAAQNIVQTAINAGGFSTLVRLLSAAGLVETLSGEGPFTVFAPNDAALPTGEALEEFIADTSLEDLTQILTYHVVPGLIMSSDLVDGAEVATVEGTAVEISLEGGAMVNDANIIAADTMTSNGVIHVIDGILMP